MSRPKILNAGEAGSHDARSDHARPRRLDAGSAKAAAFSALVVLLAASCATNAGGPDGPTDGGGADGATDGVDAASSGGTGTGSGAASSTDGVATGGGAATDGPLGTPPEEVLPFEVQGRAATLRKVKNLMTGFAPTAEEFAVLAEVPATGDAAEGEALGAALRTLVADWALTPEFAAKLLAHFRNVFQQKGFSMQEDMKGQYLEYGPFDLNPTFSYGDTAYTRLEKNFSDSFAKTALALAQSGEPFDGVLTTRTHMLTTGLIAAYLQVEQPNDAPLQFALPRTDGPTWNIDKTRDIPQEEAVSTMTWDDDAPATGSNFFENGVECDAHDYTGQNGGSALLFQRMIGLTPRWNYVANPECWEHPAKPYIEPQDTEDWRLVTITEGAPTIAPWDIPAIRAIPDGGSISLALPRVGFYTTPAFLGLWRTNDSNQHRVTANQTLIAAIGMGFTSAQELTPVTTVGLDEDHSATNAECFGCHKLLDPLREFWENQFDYNDRNDFADNQGTSGSGFPFGGTATKERPETKGGALAFLNVNETGANIDSLGPLLTSVADAEGLSRFAISMAQALCYWADSAGCAESDPEFRRIVEAFSDSNFNYQVLVTELMSSPLVTGFAHADTFDARNVVISISRREHLCAALGSRLDLGDVCGLDYAFPQMSGFSQGTSEADTVKAVFRIAGTIAIDAFSRGSEVPVTPSIPTLFYAAGTELLCENVAAKVVGTVYQTSDVPAAIAAMVSEIMGYVPAETLSDGSSPYAAAVAILQEHYDQALLESDAETALASTFSLACQAPSSLGLGI